MDKIYLINNGTKELLADVSSSDHPLLYHKLHDELNKAGEMTVKLLMSDPILSKIEYFKSEITFERNGNVLFIGEPVSPEDTSEFSSTIKVKGALSYFDYAFVGPYDYNGSVRGFLSMLVDKYNSHVDDQRKIYLGTVTISTDGNISRKSSKRVRILATMYNELADVLGGYYRIRYVNGKKYLDYLYDATRVSNQTVEYGKNLISTAIEINYQDIYSVITPEGKTDDTTHENLTIESVNNGSPHLIDSDALAKYGWREMTILYEDEADPNVMKTKATKAMSNYTSPVKNVSVRAIDEAVYNSSADAWYLGDAVRCPIPVYNKNSGKVGYDTVQMLLTERDYYALTPEKEILVFGTVRQNYSEQTKSHLNKLKEQIEVNNWNLADLINDASGLYETVKTDSDGSQKIYLHDKKSLNDSNIQLSLSTAGVFASADKGVTWYGLNFDGEAIVRLLQTEIITSPDGDMVIDLDSQSFKLGDQLEYKNGKLTLGKDVVISYGENVATKDYVDNAISEAGGMTSEMVTTITKDTITSAYLKTLNLTVGNEITMGPNATISWGQVSGTDGIATKAYVDSEIDGIDIPSEDEITLITQNSIRTANISANQITTGKLNCTDLEIEGLVVGYNVSMGKDAQLSWEQITGTDDVATKDYVDDEIGELDIPTTDVITQISRTEISTAKISATQIETGKLVCENLEITGLVVGENVTMGDTVTLSWAQITGTDDIAEKSDLDGLATEEYVDNALDGVATEDFVENEVDKIVNGSDTTNLLKLSGDYYRDGETGWVSSNNSYIAVTTHNYCTKLTRLGTGTARATIPLWSNLVSGEKYTLSFRMKRNRSANTVVRIYNASGTYAQLISVPASEITAGSYKIYKVTFTATTAMESYGFIGIATDTNYFKAGDEINIKWMKLEEGENEKPVWTEAPEDMYGSLEKIRTTINADIANAGYQSSSDVANAIRTAYSSSEFDNVVTQITKDTVTTKFVDALGITAKAVAADWVYAGAISAGQIDVSDLKSLGATIGGFTIEDYRLTTRKQFLDANNGSLETQSSSWKYALGERISVPQAYGGDFINVFRDIKQTSGSTITESLLRISNTGLLTCEGITVNPGTSGNGAKISCGQLQVSNGITCKSINCSGDASVATINSVDPAFLGNTSGTILTSNQDLNDILYPFHGYSNNSDLSKTLKNCPYTAGGFMLDCYQTTSNGFIQILHPLRPGYFYKRTRRTVNSVLQWEHWYRFNGTDAESTTNDNTATE